MGGQPYYTNAIRARRFSITIPASASTAKTVEELVAAVASSTDTPDLKRVLGVKIDGLLAGGSDRPAIQLGDAVGAMLQCVAAGKDYTEPAIDEYKTAYVKALANSPITASVILYIG